MISEQRKKIIETARSYLGVPFKHQGRSREEGIDCIGLLICVGRDCGLGDINYDCRDYGKQPSSRRLIEECEKNFDPISIFDKSQGGDIVVCWFTQKDNPQHIGIITDENTIIHTHQGTGRVIEHLRTDGWRRHIFKAYRYKGVTD